MPDLGAGRGVWLGWRPANRVWVASLCEANPPPRVSPSALRGTGDRGQGNASGGCAGAEVSIGSVARDSCSCLKPGWLPSLRSLPQARTVLRGEGVECTFNLLHRRLPGRRPLAVR